MNAQTITFTPPAALEPTAVAGAVLTYTQPFISLGIAMGVFFTALGLLIWVAKRGSVKTVKKAI